MSTIRRPAERRSLHPDRIGRLALRFALLLCFILPILSPPTSAEPTDSIQARRAARAWLRTADRHLGARLSRRIQSVATEQERGRSLYHIIRLKPEGFIIVAADDLVHPIVAFSENGAFDPSDDGPLNQLIERDLPRRIAAVQGVKLAQEKKPGEAGRLRRLRTSRDRWRALLAGKGDIDGDRLGGTGSVSDERVAPLVQSRWSQGNVGGQPCYNYYTPENYYCGCVATAMAQVMRFHEHPTTGVGTDTFTISVDGVIQTRDLRGGDGAGGPYDWADMVLVPSSGATTEQRQAIGALTHDAGVAIGTYYASSGSGAYMSDARTELVDTFDYSNAVHGRKYGQNLGDVLNDMTNPNLDAGLPVMLGISGDNGHAIICDGYGYEMSTLYHHLNFGWGGVSDAWYTLPDIGTSGNYDVVDDCIYNIYLSGSGEIVSGRVLTDGGLPVEGATVTGARTGGGTWQDVTDSKGIYALVNIPSNSSLTISAVKDGYVIPDVNANTAESKNRSADCGNVWGVDLTATGTPDLDWIEIGGPTDLDENTQGQFTCTAHYTDGSSQEVAPAWSVTPDTYGWIDAQGLFTADFVSAGQSVTVAASYTEDTITRDDTHALTVHDVVACALAVDPAETVVSGALEEFDVDVRLDNAPRLNSVAVTVSFDPLLLEVVQDPLPGGLIAQYDLPPDWPTAIEMNSTGLGVFFAALPDGGEPVNGSGVVVPIRFRVIGAVGDLPTPLALLDTALLDLADAAVAHDTADGLVTYMRKGDIDCDGDVDFWDFMLFVDVYELTDQDPGWNEYCPRADFDDDGDVDFWDFMLFVDVYES